MSNKPGTQNMGADADGRLVSACQKGDVEAFEALVERYQKKMLNIAYRMTGSYDDACDIVQDAFVSAYKEIKRFEGRAQFSTWLGTIVVNLSRNRLKQIKAVQTRREISIHAEEGAISIDPPSGEPSMLEMMEKRDVQKGVQECIGKLDMDFRAVVVLRDIQGYAYNEIGEMLRIAEGTVKSRLFRAREMLKNCLRKTLGVL